jgi:hypothetical protein
MCAANPSDDILETYVGSIRRATATDQLRQRLLNQTMKYTRRRRFRRWFTYAIGMAVCYVGGLVTAWPLSGIKKRHSESITVADRANVKAVTLTDVKTIPIELSDEPASTLELLAARSPRKERARLYREAGDRYLAENPADIAAGLRCYSAMLDALDERDLLTSEPTDHWLLAALKDARRKDAIYDAFAN